MIRTNNDPLFCPSEATEERERIQPPATKSDKEFHKWANATYREYLEVYSRRQTLLECWYNEQNKRAG